MINVGTRTMTKFVFFSKNSRNEFDLGHRTMKIQFAQDIIIAYVRVVT